MKTALILAALLLGQSVSMSNNNRTWTNTAGKTIIAEQTGFDAAKQTVELKTPEGRIYTLSLDSLSKADQEIARGWKEPPSVSVTIDVNVVRITNTSKTAHVFRIYFLSVGPERRVNGVPSRRVAILNSSGTSDPFADTSFDSSEEDGVTIEAGKTLNYTMSQSSRLDDLVVTITDKEYNVVAARHTSSKSEGISKSSYIRQKGKEVLIALLDRKDPFVAPDSENSRPEVKPPTTPILSDPFVLP